MSITRSKTFVELVAQRTPSAARSDLDVYSKAEVDSEINAIDLSAYTLNSTTVAVSGALSNEINVLETTVQDISGALTIDIENLDLSLTQAIMTHITVDGTAPATSGAMFAWGRIDNISGGPLYVQLFA